MSFFRKIENREINREHHKAGKRAHHAGQDPGRVVGPIIPLWVQSMQTLPYGIILT
jgi:hypothetical protein